MKKDFNHIEEVFKKAFDGFEANVDPSVWSNVQSNIGAGNGVPSNPYSVASSMSKAVLTKIIAGVVIATGIATAVYFIADSSEGEIKPTETVANNITEINQEELTVQVEGRIDPVQNKDEAVAIKTKIQSVSTNTENQKLIENNKNQESQQLITQENKTSTNVVSAQQNTSTEVTPKNPSNSINAVDKKEVEKVDLVVKIKSSTTKGKAPLEVEFNVDGNAVAYSWDFGDGSEISGQENSFHTYTNSGKYTVKLTAIDKNANAKTVLQVITVEQNIKSSLSTIPTVFSPNSDGINDVIKIDGENIKSFHAIVRDGQGNVVFEWKTLEGFWDGRDLNNQILPKGTYYIIVVAVGVDGEPHPVKQIIQLF